jgi:cytochrome c oxidase subunit 2
MKSVKFIFLPGSGVPLTVPADRKITFHITSPDVLHGFQVVGTNINATAIPGQVTTFGTIFPETGTYGVICNEYCGAAHHTMKAQIEVVPESEIDSTMLVSAR